MTAVLVTGAAGGLGAALVEALVARGDDVVALDRRDVGTSQGVRSFTVDLLDEAAVSAALAAAAADGIAICHVVAIAGGALPEEKACVDPAALPLEVVRRSLDQNLTSAFVTLQAALPYLRTASGNRSITLTSSTDAIASYGLPAYAAAKAGLLGLVRSLAATLGADGIRINAVAPGDVPTERNVREWAHVPGWYDRLREASVLDRLATPADIAATYLAVIDLEHLTGQTIVVDGGQTIARPDAGARAANQGGTER